MPRRIVAWFICVLLPVLSGHSLAAATDFVVSVTGIKESTGEIGIALFSEETGFPLDSRNALQIWLPARDASGGGMEHTFTDLPAGRYAIAVSHDRNGNRKTDTNWIGIPKEPWGVSNGIRPQLRAPTFAEAAFDIPTPSEGQLPRISVSLLD